MSVKDQIARVLWKHLLLHTNPPGCGCGGWYGPGAWNEHVADILLSSPGIAIVSAEDLQIVLRNAGYHGIAGSYGEWVTAHHRVTAAALAADAAEDA